MIVFCFVKHLQSRVCIYLIVWLDDISTPVKGVCLDRGWHFNNKCWIVSDMIIALIFDPNSIRSLIRLMHTNPTYVLYKQFFICPLQTGQQASHDHEPQTSKPVQWLISPGCGHACEALFSSGRAVKSEMVSRDDINDHLEVTLHRWSRWLS